MRTFYLTPALSPVSEYGAGSEGEGVCRLVFMLACTNIPTPVSSEGDSWSLPRTRYEGGVKSLPAPSSLG